MQIVHKLTIKEKQINTFQASKNWGQIVHTYLYSLLPETTSK